MSHLHASLCIRQKRYNHVRIFWVYGLTYAHVRAMYVRGIIRAVSCDLWMSVCQCSVDDLWMTVYEYFFSCHARRSHSRLDVLHIPYTCWYTHECMLAYGLMHIYIYTCMHTCIQTWYSPPSIPHNIHTRTYMQHPHTHIHACLHTHIHTHTHTCNVLPSALSSLRSSSMLRDLPWLPQKSKVTAITTPSECKPLHWGARLLFAPFKTTQKPNMTGARQFCDTYLCLEFSFFMFDCEAHWRAKTLHVCVCVYARARV